MPVGSNFTIHPEIKQIMATYRRSKSGATQTEGPSNSASPASSIGLSNFSSVHGTNNNAPKYGTLVPNRIFVGGISANTTESELSQLFSKYGNVKATKIIADRAGVSKGYGFVTFDTEEEVRCLIQDSSNIVLKERRLNIAPAVKKQPSFSRSFEAASPPPATTNLYFHNGVPYTFHNGMAFFPPTAPQPALAALPPSTDQPMYPTYGPTQNTAPAPYGTPVLLPAPPSVYMPQNYSYQPLPMTNGASTQFIYTGPGSTNGGAGSPLAGTPDNPSLPTPLTPQYYTQPFAPQETFYHHATSAVYLYPYAGEYEAQEQQIIDVQHYERQHVAPRWNVNPQQAKRLVYNKRPNGSTSNMAVTTTNNIRLAKKHQVTVDGDLGGGGDAQPAVQLALTPPRSPSADMDEDNTSKMESLSLATSS